MKKSAITAILLVVGLGLQGIAAAQWVYTPETKRFINIKKLPKETPELQVEFARSLMLAGEYKKAWRETQKFEEYYGDTDWADDNQFLRGEIRQAQGKLVAAAKEFQQVIGGFPNSNRYDEVIARQYKIGDALYEKGKENQKKSWWHFWRKRPFAQAIDVYSMVIDNEPFSKRAAEAQYKVGLCHFALGENIEAAYEYRRVIEDYSTSEWVDDASYGLAECYCKASLPPEYDQSSSLLAIQSIDAFLEQFGDDPRGEELKKQRVKMRERVAEQRLQTAQFYEKRREFRAARISYEVVVEQFPETKSAEKARKWLQENSGTGKGI